MTLYPGEIPRYEIELEGRVSHCEGHEALLYFLSQHREKPITVRRVDWPPFINHYIEESAIQAAVADRDSGEVTING